MKLMTKELESKIPALRSQEKLGTDAIVYVHYFHPLSNWDWYATEYDPDERLFFGYVNGFEGELGYFSLDELESVVVRGLKIERDLYWIPKKLKDAMK